MGITSGPTRDGPCTAMAVTLLSMVGMPPPPVFMTTATRSRFSSVISNLASAIASLVPAIAKCAKRSIRRTDLGSMNALGSKSGTSAAILTGRFSVSKCWTRRTPERPEINPSQSAGTPMPSGETAPSPVTTTRFTLSPSLLKDFACIACDRRSGVAFVGRKTEIGQAKGGDVPIDAADETGEHLARPNFDKCGRAAIDHLRNRPRPVHGALNMMRQFLTHVIDGEHRRRGDVGHDGNLRGAEWQPAQDVA